MSRQDSPLAFDDGASSWYLEQTPAGSKDLCDRCEEVLSLAASNATSKASVHHRCAGSFFKAADGRCLICSYLCGKIPWKADFFPDEILEAIVPGAPFSTYSVHRTRLELRLEWVGESYDPGKGLIWSLPYPLNRNAPPSFVSDRPTYNLDFRASDCKRSSIERQSIPSAIGLAERMPQIKSWLDECDGQHSTCRSLKRASGYIPTRLLDLGSPRDPYVRLVQSHECPAPCRYVTLSHCWGATRMDGPSRLLQANYATMRAGIANLPRTFLEAVQVARHLQVRYLWVDSLCIIQDSPHDWEAEVSRMGQIYSNSHCNIAAAGARNSAGGLYLEQNPRLQPPWRLYLRDAHSQAAKLMELSASAPIGDEFAAAALASRAWALQERLLAPRTLHFARQRIYWDCGHSFTWEGSAEPRTASQLSTSSYRPSWVTPLTDAKLSLASLLYQSRQHAALAVLPPPPPPPCRHEDKTSPASANVDVDEVAMIHAQWTAIIAHYTTLSLAKQRDKLPALSGLANLFQSLLNDASSSSSSSLPSPSSSPSSAPSASLSPLSSSPSRPSITPPSPPSTSSSSSSSSSSYLAGIFFTTPPSTPSTTTPTPLSTHRQLLWRRARSAPTNPLRDTDATVAPTWSWASLENTPIVYPGSSSSSTSTSTGSTGVGVGAAWPPNGETSVDYRATIAIEGGGGGGGANTTPPPLPPATTTSILPNTTAAAAAAAVRPPAPAAVVPSKRKAAAAPPAPAPILHVRGKLDRSFWRHTLGREQPLGGRRSSSASSSSSGGRRRRDFVYVEECGGGNGNGNGKKRRRTELRVEMDADECGGGGGAEGGDGYGVDSDDDDDGGDSGLAFLAVVAYRVERRDARVVEGLVLERAWASRVKDSWQRVGVFVCEYAGVVAEWPGPGPGGVGAGWGGLNGGGGGAVGNAAPEVGKGSAEELYQNFLALPDKSMRLV
ncbi:uncharacterized protein BKCO1_26000146 [Diplodia corticola]|uniref:Heterokaryon incompatibility domain-containing protein n=1 Tax=Diplodia corticola TaxID=236234 RepID=A0A1J9R050_9PEZI|nr:uncharacterized protein BKCO1_26000146 [Diplodia corticola]OJD33985.1 hypothetical protein BKCO1_26000146 [Diplodia corticola]